MTVRTDKRGFTTRPEDHNGWIRSGGVSRTRGTAAATNSARLTINVTPMMRGRIKVAAFSRGITVADMLGELLAREFPPHQEIGHDRCWRA